MNITEEEIARYAGEAGFDACGVTDIGPMPEDSAYLTRWNALGYAGNMGYMNRYTGLRADPTLLLPGARCAVVTLLSYYPRERQPEDAPQIATYAYGADYHYIVKHKLRHIADRLTERLPGSSSAVFTDSAPLFERQLAQRAGLGWIGKSGMLINPRLGSYTFIGTLLTTAKIVHSTKTTENRCGNCTVCIESCPTRAIIAPYTLDARRCISYQTIENREPMPEWIAGVAANRLFGCDGCLEACPWNRHLHPHNHQELNPLEGLFGMDWANLTRGGFDRMFAHSPLRRAGYRKIKERINAIMESKRCT